MTCAYEGCEATKIKARFLCKRHYERAIGNGTLQSYPLMHPDKFHNPLVCVCLEPQADTAVDFGMCQVCKRPVVALMRIMQVAS